MDTKGDLPIIPFASRGAWEAWLADEHASSSGLWLKLAKVGAGVGSVSYAEAVEVALCYGWIDGQAARYDEAYWLQRFTPPPPQEQLVEDQPREGDRAHRARGDAALWLRGGRASQGRRPVGRGLRVPVIDVRDCGKPLCVIVAPSGFARSCGHRTSL